MKCNLSGSQLFICENSVINYTWKVIAFQRETFQGMFDTNSMAVRFQLFQEPEI